MRTERDPFSHFAAVLPVIDPDRSIAFYTEKLGFKATFTWNDPIDYAVLKRGEISIHLTKRDDGLSPSPIHTSIYIFVRDIESVYQTLKGKGVNIKTPLDERDYRMKDFDILDPDGYIISFGENSTH